MVKQQTQQIITKDIRIGDILMINPSKAQLASQILNDFGIHCTSCGAASFETLEQGVIGHGFSEKDLDKLLIDLNKAISEGGEIKEIKENDFKLIFSPIAVKKVKEAIKSQGKKLTSTLRVSVLAGGCSGFLYDLQFIDKPSKADLNFKQDGINIAVDKKSMEMLNGIEIDYIDTLNESGFKFNNPNSSGGCGCGKSFH
ncbi:MAG: iron-sulfur cluster assembly accessory protein [Nanoarchaeota archaeon]